MFKVTLYVMFGVLFWPILLLMALWFVSGALLHKGFRALEAITDPYDMDSGR